MTDNNYEYLKRKILKKYNTSKTEDFLNYVINNVQLRSIFKEIIKLNDIEKHKYKKLLKERIFEIEELLDDDLLLESDLDSNILEDHIPFDHYYKDIDSGLFFLNLEKSFFKDSFIYNNSKNKNIPIETKEFKYYLTEYVNNNKKHFVLDCDMNSFVNDLTFNLNQFLNNYFFEFLFLDIFDNEIFYSNALYNIENYLTLEDFLQEKTFSDYHIKDISIYELCSEFIERFIYLISFKLNKCNHNFNNNSKFKSIFIEGITHNILSFLLDISFDEALIHYDPDSSKENYISQYNKNLNKTNDFIKFIKNNFKLQEYDLIIGDIQTKSFDTYKSVKNYQDSSELYILLLEIYYFGGFVVNNDIIYEFDIEKRAFNLIKCEIEMKLIKSKFKK